jgi:DNA-binding HxlR family transcriptional regulator
VLARASHLRHGAGDASKELERKGVVRRQVIESSPPSVEYSPNTLGLERVPAIESIAHVGYRLRQQSC